jgi:hypothetical protein
MMNRQRQTTKQEEFEPTTSESKPSRPVPQTARPLGQPFKRGDERNVNVYDLREPTPELLGALHM